MPHNQVKGHQIHQALLAAAHQHDDGTDVGAFICDALRDLASMCEILGYPDTYKCFDDHRDALEDCRAHHDYRDRPYTYGDHRA